MTARTLDSTDASIASRMVPFGVVGSDERAAYRVEQANIVAAHRAYLEEQVLGVDVAQETRDAIYDLAWSEGHSSGFSEVENHYRDYADLVEVALRNA